MEEQKIFYYKFKPLNLWLIFNLIFLTGFIFALIKCPFLQYWWQMKVLLGTLLFSFLVWGWKYLAKHRLAIINNEGIKIDHCQILPWKDIQNAEEKIIRCGLRHYKVLILNPKAGINYHYNFLQKHNCNFTAFSIPLYNIIRPEDAKEICEIISQKVNLIKLPEV